LGWHEGDKYGHECNITEKDKEMTVQYRPNREGEDPSFCGAAQDDLLGCRYPDIDSGDSICFILNGESST